MGLLMQRKFSAYFAVRRVVALNQFNVNFEQYMAIEKLRSLTFVDRTTIGSVVVAIRS